LIQRAADDATIPGKASTAKRVADVLAKVRNPLVRDLYVRDLAAKLAVPVAQVMRMVREATSHAPRTEAAASVTTSAAEASPMHRAPQPDELDALALLVAQPKLANSPEVQQIYELLRDPGIREIYGNALEALRAGDRADVPAWLDSGPTDIRDQVSAALMDGRWAAIEAGDDAMRAMRALVVKLERLRVDSELALAQRQYREALARGNEEEARAISMREMELIRTKLGLANQSKGMTT
ncbi:MAG TPA: hypothetical protein VF550_04520, partial [Polyangia bacterium]